MTDSRLEFSSDEPPILQEYLDTLVRATCRANESYEEITTEDMVAVLRHQSQLYAEFGREALHPRNQTEDDEIPVLNDLLIQSDGDVESTDRRAYQFDVGLVTGAMYGTEITDEEISTVLKRLAEYLETHGRPVVKRPSDL